MKGSMADSSPQQRIQIHTKFIYNYYSVQSVKALEMQSNLNPLFSTGYNLSLFQPKLDGNYTVCPHNLHPRWCHKLLHFSKIAYLLYINLTYWVVLLHNFCCKIYCIILMYQWLQMIGKWGRGIFIYWLLHYLLLWNQLFYCLQT